MGEQISGQMFSNLATGTYSSFLISAGGHKDAPRDVDVIAAADHYELIADLQGADEDDVVVGVLDHVLTVGSKTATETCRDIGNFLVVDHRERSIEQSFALPGDADEDDMYLKFADGKLSVIIGRKPSGPMGGLAFTPRAAA